MPAAVWLVIAVALCIGEVFTLDLVLIMLGGAALAGAGTALATDALPAQAAAVAVAAVVLLALVRPVARRHLEAPSMLAGGDRLRGRSALVVQAVSAGGGQVRLDGELWRARPMPGAADVPVGGTVVVASVEGATLQVYSEELA